MTDVFPQAWEGPATGPGSLALLPAAEEGAANVQIKYINIYSDHKKKETVKE
jgi:hypothetical protein